MLGGGEPGSSYDLPISADHFLQITKYDNDVYHTSSTREGSITTEWTQDELVEKLFFLQDQGKLDMGSKSGIPGQLDTWSTGPSAADIPAGDTFLGAYDRDPLAIPGDHGAEMLRAGAENYKPTHFKSEAGSSGADKMRQMRYSEPALQNGYQQLMTRFPRTIVTEVWRSPDSPHYVEGTDHSVAERSAFDVRTKSAEGKNIKEAYFTSTGELSSRGQLALNNMGMSAILENVGQPDEHIHFYIPD